MSNHWNDQRGLTLTELLAVIVILGIIGSYVFRYIDFGLGVFTDGSAYADNQANLRLTAFRITDEVRNVRNINLLAVPDPSDSDALDEYIWLDGNRVASTVISTSTTNYISDDLIQSMDCSLRLENDKYILGITLVGQEGHSISTDILLNNMATGAASVKNTSGSVIEFDFNAP